jgi:anthranilate synthase/aminodeoxychorismate synthase-like glutamine amidotransferase
MKVLMIDNFDSFTYNLVDEFKKQGCEVLTYRNNLNLNQLDHILTQHHPNLIILSPGPGHPKNAGICISLIKKYSKKYSILGICLGHQCLIEAFGGTISNTTPVHGKKSNITHTGSPIFEDIPRKFSAGRYHSLYASTVPKFFKITAKLDYIPMCIENSQHKICGLQFHPESILTTHGSRIIQNILESVK